MAWRIFHSREDSSLLLDASSFGGSPTPPAFIEGLPLYSSPALALPAISIFFSLSASPVVVVTFRAPVNCFFFFKND